MKSFKIRVIILNENIIILLKEQIMGIFSFLKSKNAGAFDNSVDKSRKKLIEARLIDYKKSLTQMKTTFSVDEFFKNYAIWLDAINLIRDEIPPNDMTKWCREYPEIFELDSSEGVRSKLQIALMRRLLGNYEASSLNDEMHRYSSLMTAAAVEYFENNVGSLHTDSLSEGELIFCKVSFNYSEKTYYYLTNDITLSKGDEVIVPTGDEDKCSVGTVRGVEYKTPENAPYPIDKIKRIIRKA